MDNFVTYSEILERIDYERREISIKREKLIEDAKKFETFCNFIILDVTQESINVCPYEPILKYDSDLIFPILKETINYTQLFDYRINYISEQLTEIEKLKKGQVVQLRIKFLDFNEKCKFGLSKVVKILSEQEKESIKTEFKKKIKSNIQSIKEESYSWLSDDSILYEIRELKFGSSFEDLFTTDDKDFIKFYKFDE